jgi:hypothetical protein
MCHTLCEQHKQKAPTEHIGMLRRHFSGDRDRTILYASMRTMRDACIDANRIVPLGGLDYRTASELMP